MNRQDEQIVFKETSPRTDMDSSGVNYAGDKHQIVFKDFTRGGGNVQNVIFRDSVWAGLDSPKTAGLTQFGLVYALPKSGLTADYIQAGSFSSFGSFGLVRK